MPCFGFRSSVGNTSMFPAVAEQCCMQPRTPTISHCPTMGAQGAGRGRNEDSWPSLAKGTFRTVWHGGEGEFRKGWDSALLLLLGGGGRWASVRGGEQLCASLVTYLHIRTVITVSLFLFSILINSFISAQKFYLVFVPPVLLWEWGGQWAAEWRWATLQIKSQWFLLQLLQQILHVNSKVYCTSLRAIKRTWSLICNVERIKKKHLQQKMEIRA